jgi:hypothetical protein
MVYLYIQWRESMGEPLANFLEGIGNFYEWLIDQLFC